jgi:hypothetical protein
MGGRSATTAPLSRSFELTYLMRVELTEPVFSTAPDRMRWIDLPPELVAEGAVAYAARERRLFDALVRSPTVLSRWLAFEAMSTAAFEHEPYEQEGYSDELIAPVVARLPAPERDYFETLSGVADNADWMFPFEQAFDEEVTGVRAAAHPPKPSIEGRVALPAVRWYRATIAVDAHFVAVPWPATARIHNRLLEHHPDLACASVGEFRARIQRVVDAHERDVPLAEAYLQRRSVRLASDSGAEWIIDRRSDEEVKAVIAELGQADRDYYARAETLGFLWEATEVLRGASRARTESYEVRMVA